jgi:16S rRNA (cytosine967-C5)-methyltransferase
VIELLCGLRSHWRSDKALPSRIDALLRSDRRLGSSDRRLYRELIYTALRYLPWVEPLIGSRNDEAIRRLAWLAGDTPAVLAFRSAIGPDLPACPSGVDEKAAFLAEEAGALTPAWFTAECPGAAAPPLRETLLSRAPLWIRIQGEGGGAVLEEFDRLGWAWSRSTFVPGAVRLPADSRVESMEAFKAGAFEIQDAGSQRVLGAVEVPPGGHWLDACAGAGGKTLQLAGILGETGHVTAEDIRTEPLDELRLRAGRAGLAGRIRIGGGTAPAAGYDGALVDAPCTGTGTWRRSPHLRWTTRRGQIPVAAAEQLRLLCASASRIRRGGLLVYSTCSLCRTENEGVVDAFLNSGETQATLVTQERLLPQDHDGDGFFVACLRKS